MDVFYCYLFNQVSPIELKDLIDREDMAKLAAVQFRSNRQRVDVQHENMHIKNKKHRHTTKPELQ